MKKNNIYFLEDDPRIIRAIPTICEIGNINVTLISSEEKGSHKTISKFCEIVFLSGYSVKEKLEWFYKNIEKGNSSSLIIGANSSKKDIVQALLKFGNNLIRRRIYGYAPFFIPAIQRSVFILDPLVQIDPSVKDLTETALDFILELNSKYSKEVQGVFISHVDEWEPTSSKQWKTIKELYNGQVYNYFYGTTQFDRAIFNELTNKDGSKFGSVNTIIFPDLNSANAVFKALSIADSNTSSSGAIIGGLNEIGHGIISRNCRIEQIVSMAHELNR